MLYVAKCFTTIFDSEVDWLAQSVTNPIIVLNYQPSSNIFLESYPIEKTEGSDAVNDQLLISFDIPEWHYKIQRPEESPNPKKASPKSVRKPELLESCPGKTNPVPKNHSWVTVSKSMKKLNDNPEPSC